MMRESVVTTVRPSARVSVKGRLFKSTLITLPWMTSVPNRSACARISAIRSGPMMPSRNPGQLSTIVVSISCPPASRPSMRSGARLARAAYRAAVRPAGPEPMITTLRSAIVVSEMLVDQLCDVFLRREPDHRFRQLAVLEQQQRGNAANHEAAGDVGILVHVELGHRGAT